MKKIFSTLFVAFALTLALAACQDANVVTLSEISMKAAPEKTEYYVGESLDVKGAKLLAKYSDGTEKEVDLAPSMLSAVDMNTAGEKTVTVSYTENTITKTTSFKVTVREKTVVEEHLSAMLTDWYEKNENHYLDTSVTFDNKAVPYDTWKRVSFTVYRGEEVIGSAVSTGENLVELLGECAEDWTNKESALTLSCPFMNRPKSADNGKWIYSAFALTHEDENQADGLKVEIETADKIYRKTFQKQAADDGENE